ncbi:MAG TPA: fimbria/pilus outer membrane usher protein [Aromatoleum sp.]|uniref:fimbria/pilus outer membrane usher protein n=1 Tax=Aromatoleum sp. TaxID=2307007 RepID=UPI002B4A1FFB|nr:fimbria/pilus outer membrane usher protein [Aromatoleum sp.]HJV24993.1 fimbria/pilus outer membrane usher protein [Aromatoleum sp.]
MSSVMLAMSGPATADDSLPAAGAAVLTVPRLRAPYVEAWLAVRINGSLLDMPARVVLDDGGRAFVTATDLSRWRLRLPQVPPLAFKGKEYFPLDAVPGLDHRIDEREQALVLEGRPEAFALTTIAPRRAGLNVNDPGAVGGFLNYDLLAVSQEGRHTFDGLLEAGLSTPAGFGTSTFLGHAGEGPGRFLRLETAWTRDDTEAYTTTTFGDSVSRPGAWGRAVRFGGMQWGTNFATRPDFVPFPLPTLRGEAAVPSTVDLYVDNALRMSRSVPYGPFEIPRAPLITGDGQVRLVVRDVMGKEVVVTQPYYVSSSLLQPGLHDYTYEAGFQRRRFAAQSNDYGGFFLAGTHRKGLSEQLTAEFRGELLEKQQTAGIAATYLIPSLGVISAATAASHSELGEGGFLSLGIERQGRPLSFGVEARRATPRFAQLGGAPDYRVPTGVQIARASFAAGRAGSFFVSYLRQTDRALGETKLLTSGYAVSLPGNVHLSLFGLRTLGGDRSYSIGLNVTYVLGAQTTASAGWNRDASGSASSLQLQQSLPPGSGLGYRVAAESGANARTNAALLLRNEVGTYSLEAVRSAGSTSYRVGASGGVAIVDGKAYPTRRIDDAFALVQVGDYDDVDIYLDNQPVARTREGYALVTGLRPYQSNSITIRPEDLPLDAEVGALRMSLSLSRHGAGVVRFPVRAVRGALLRIVLEDGSPLPAGATLTPQGGTDTFPVGLRGEAYVKGLGKESRFEARWKGRSCMVEVTMPKNAGPLPVIGPLTCSGTRI